MSRLAAIIRGRLDALGLRQADLGNALGYSSEVFVAHVLAGRKAIPPDRIADWAEVLRLHGEDRDEFTWEAGIMSVPQSIRAGLVRLRRDNETLRGLAADVLRVIAPDVPAEQVDDLLSSLHDPDAVREKWRKIARAMQRWRKV